jgi:hypothetical protein
MRPTDEVGSPGPKTAQTTSRPSHRHGTDNFLVQILQLLTTGFPTPRAIVASDTGLESELPETWTVTAASTVVGHSWTVADADEPSPLLLVPGWDRPRGRGLSSHHRAVFDAPGWAEPLFVLLPTTDLDSRSGASFRTRLLANWHLDLVIFLSDVLPGVHSGFEAALLMLHAGAGHGLPIHLFNVARTRTSDHAALLQELTRLLRMSGGSTENGYVLRGAPNDERLGFARNHPRRLANRRALAEYGGTQRIDDLFDLLPSVVGLPVQSESSQLKGEKVRLLGGRDIQFGRIVDDHTDSPTGAVPRSMHLQVGDVVFRSITSVRPGQGFVSAVVLMQDLPAATDHTVIALRAKAETLDHVASFVLRFLASASAVELADASRIGGAMRLGRSELASMIVPVPDDAMTFAIKAITDARDSAARWQEEAEELLGSVFDAAPPAENRERVLRSSRSLRHRITAAQLTEELGQKVRSRYPLPVASRWRVTHAELSTGPSSEGYRMILETAEVLLGYLACVGLALAVSCGLTLGAQRELRKKLAKNQGPAFADWVAVLQELSGAKANSVRELLHADDLSDYIAAPGVAEAVTRLTTRRNDESHVRRVEPTDLPNACKFARSDLELLLVRASFVEDLPLLLAGAVQWDSFSRSGVLPVQPLAGDHPVVPTDMLPVHTPAIESGSLYLQDLVGDLHLLRPFLIAQTCPTCRTLSTFHVDKAYQGYVSLKSFEHGHTTDGRGMKDALISVGLLGA